MRRLRSSPQDRDRGTTLAELAVTMLVFGLFGTFLATTITQATRLARTSAVREDTAQRASLLVAQVTRDLRTAVRVGKDGTTQTAFTSAQPNAVSFFSSAAPHVLRERLLLATSAANATAGTTCSPATTSSTCELWRETQRPDDLTVFPDLRYTDPTRTKLSRVISADLPYTVSLKYVLKGSPAPVVVSSVADTDLVGLQSILAVQVKVTVDGDGPGRLKPVVLESTVRPYNS